MPDIFLRSGEAQPTDVRLRDPTVADSGGSIVGALTATEAGDTLAGGATLALVATAAIGGAGDTATAGAALALAVTVVPVETDDIVTGIAALVLTGSVATLIEADDTVAADAALRMPWWKTYIGKQMMAERERQKADEAYAAEHYVPLYKRRSYRKED